MPCRIEELCFGESVCDMHDGEPDVQKLFDNPKASITRRYHLHTPGGSKAIESMVHAHHESQPTKHRCRRRKTSYVNKLLVLVGVGDCATGMVYEFAYSYDDRHMGFLDVLIPFDL